MHHRVPRLAVGGEHQERVGVGVARRDRDRAVLGDRVGLDVVSRQALQGAGRDAGLPRSVADVAGERLAEVGAACGELAQPGAGLLVAVDAATLEGAQRVLQHPLRAVGQSVGGGGLQHGIDPGVEHERGPQLVQLLLVALRALAQRSVGVHLGEQAGHGEGVAEVDVHVVPPRQARRVAGRGRAQGLDALPRALEPAEHLLVEEVVPAVEVVHGGQGHGLEVARCGRAIGRHAARLPTRCHGGVTPVGPVSRLRPG